jgi:hypothetical protein
MVSAVGRRVGDRIVFEDGLDNSKPSPHDALRRLELLTSRGLPKREPSIAVMAMSKTVILATFFILFFCSSFSWLENMWYARCSFDLELWSNMPLGRPLSHGNFSAQNLSCQIYVHILIVQSTNHETPTAEKQVDAHHNPRTFSLFWREVKQLYPWFMMLKRSK